MALEASLWAQDAAHELRPGQHYERGAMVRDSARAVSFTLPADWMGRMPVDSEVLLLSSPTHDGVGLVALLDTMTGERLVERLSEPQEFGEAVVLQLSKPIEQVGQQWLASYLSGHVVGRATALLGPDAQAVVFFFAGPHAEAKAFERALAELAASTQFESIASL